MPNEANLAGKVARGASLMVGLRLAMRGLSVISQLILVRLLSPDDFGLVAGAGAALAILDGLTETSMSLAIVQMAAPERGHYQSAWTLVFLRGLLVAAAIWFAAPHVAQYLHDPRVTAILHVLAIAPLAQGLESAGMVRLQRDLQFGRIFFYQLAGKAAGLAIALPLAFLFHNYWALVLGGLASRVLVIPLSYLLAPFRPRLNFRHAGALLNFSKWLLLNNVLTMADNFMMPLTLGRVSNVRAIGLYQVAYDLAALPASEIAAPIRRPMHAGYARLTDDKPALRQQVLDGLGIVVLMIVPLAAGLAVTAPHSVPVLLGPQWLAAIPALSLAAIYALFDAIGHFSGGIYMVLNAQRRYVAIMAACLALRLALVIPAAILGGLNPAMAMMALTAVINAYFWWSSLRPLLEITWHDLARATWRSFAGGAVMAMAVALAGAAMPTTPGLPAMLAALAALCGLGAVVHIGTQALLWRLAGSPAGAEALVLTRLRKIGRNVLF